MKRFLYNNEVMRIFSSFSAFQKLLAFFVPIIVYIPLYTIITTFGSLPSQGFFRFLQIFILWLPVITWSYLIISVQVHLQQKTRSLIANIVFFIVTIAAIVFYFLPL